MPKTPYGRAKENAPNNPPCPITPTLTSSSVHHSSHQLTTTCLSYYHLNDHFCRKVTYSNNLLLLLLTTTVGLLYVKCWIMHHGVQILAWEFCRLTSKPIKWPVCCAKKGMFTRERDTIIIIACLDGGCDPRHGRLLSWLYIENLSKKQKEVLTENRRS